MPQFENSDIFAVLLRSTISIIGRRTSEAYANVVIGKTVKDLEEKYDFLSSIIIQGTRYTEDSELVKIGSDINNIELKEIVNAIKDFFKELIEHMGKDAGYYFIKEIKENIPFHYEKKIRELGVDLDYLQLEFITDMKQTFRLRITNSDLLLYSIRLIFNTLEREFGREKSYLIIFENVGRLKTEYEALKFVNINDIRSIQGVDIVTVDSSINEMEPSTVGGAIQRIIQDMNNTYAIKNGQSLVEKMKIQIKPEYKFKLTEIGVNLDVIVLSNELVIKNVIIALVDVLSVASNRSFAIMVIKKVLNEFGNRFIFLRYIKIENDENSEQNENIVVSSEIDSVKQSELGRGIQKMIEHISISLGDQAGPNFIKKFQRRLGKAYVLRIEKMGVNLHMIELKRNLAW